MTHQRTFGPTPAASTGVRFLHTADWQLGMTRHFLDSDAQPRYTGARIDAIGAIGELAAVHHCDFVLVCGDVFESNAVSPRVVSRSLERMRAIPVPVYLLPGNHDPLDGASVYTSPTFTAAQPDNVRVLTDSGIHQVRTGLEIVAAPWFSKTPLTDLVSDVLQDLAADGTVRVVAGHGAVDLLTPESRGPAMISLATIEAALADGRIHYVALGDRHSVTSVGSSGRVWYPGTQEVTDYDEKYPGEVLVVDLGPGDVLVNRHRVGAWAFRDLRFTVDSRADVADLDLALAAMTDKDRTVVRLSLTGTLSLSERAALDLLLDEQRRLFAAIQIWDLHTDLAVVVDDNELSDLGVSGFAQTAVTELAERAEGAGPEADTARDALSLLYRLAGGRR